MDSGFGGREQSCGPGSYSMFEGQMPDYDIQKLSPCLWEIPRTGRMRVPARIYATEKLIGRILADQGPTQAVNVAHLPGIVRASLAMPDMHWGYGFPIGGVAAFDEDEGVISPGGVGYDINCGVRLMASNLSAEEVRPRLSALLNRLFDLVPSGVGSTSVSKVSVEELRRVVTEGSRWAVSKGFGTETDLDRTEENGCIGGADPDQVSDRAWQRGRGQLGTLGSGNHFLELGVVSEIYDEALARAMGLFPGQLTVIVHCGSRGFGHQVCDDSLAVMDRAAAKYGIELPDRQLACAPIKSAEGEAYFGAMRCAVNFAFANRQMIAHKVGDAFTAILGKSSEEVGLRTVYEVAHNIAKFETHNLEGRSRRLCVHRKGATRAFGPGRREVPDVYRQVGQPVLIPGDMGRCSFVLAGTEGAMAETFGSTCHGAGRSMSRHQAKKAARGRDIAGELASDGILVKARSRGTLAEEIPEAYKDVTEVVEACVQAGISKRVAKLKPLACVKG